MSYYPPYKSSSNNIKVELDLTNYATKTDLNNITHVDTSSFASKTSLAALKTEVDIIDVAKLKTAPTDLAKLTNALSKEFFDIQATVECGFTLKLVRDMIKTYNQMHRTDKYSQLSSII